MGSGTDGGGNVDAIVTMLDGKARHTWQRQFNALDDG
jgi:hypothetical protein